MDDLSSSKWRNRAKLELWANDVKGTVQYLCDDAGTWSATATVRSNPDTWIISSGPHDSVEQACAAVIERLGKAGHVVPEVHGNAPLSPDGDVPRLG